MAGLSEKEFACPPKEARPLTWWHWINGNSTKEGIRADLEDMKRVGIAGAQMFDVSLYLPPGPVRYGSDAWHENVQYAIKTANELGLDFMTTACPGWSETGGPWVTPEKSMKMIVWSETAVAGGRDAKVTLPQPKTNKDFYRDVAVLAVPDDSVETSRPAVSCNVASVEVSRLCEPGNSKEVVFPESQPTPAITLAYPAAVQRRQLVLTFAPDRSRLQYTGRVEASDDGVKFRQVRGFNVTTTGAQDSIPVIFEPTTARYFRVVLKGDPKKLPWPMRLTGLHLSDELRVDDLAAKTGLAKIRSETRKADLHTAEAGAIPPDKILDLTAKMAADGTLAWKAPPGAWTVFRFGYTSTGSTNHPAVPEGYGLEVDKFDPDAVRFHCEKALGRVIREAGPLAGKTYNGILCDSWEAGPQNWTAAFPELFRQIRGYDIEPFLVCLAGRVVGSSAQTEAFLSDFRRTLGELYARNHYAVLRQFAHEHGLKLYAETYAGVLDEDRCAEEVDVPMGEFWIHMYSKSCRNITSLAHTAGKNVVAAESFTSRPPDGRWQDSPQSLKPIGDKALVMGINRYCFHSYVHQPRSDLAPGFTQARYGTQFGRLNSWWKYAPAWIEYIARCQYLLQQGACLGDILYYRHDDLDHTAVDDYPDVPKGYDAHFIAARQLMQATGEKGAITLADGARYRAIVFPAAWTASVELLEKIGALADAGVLVMGPPPVAPTGRMDLMEHAAQWKSLVAKIWDAKRDNVIADAKLLPDALTKAGVTSDFCYTSAPADADVQYIHRSGAGWDAYFLSNQSGQRVTIAAEFRAGGRQPELWDAVSGTIRKATSFEIAGGRVRLPLTLDAGGSVFVVFRAAAPKTWIASVARAGAAVANDAEGESDDMHLVTAEPGEYVVRYSDGQERKIAVAAEPAPLAVAGPWRVAFEAGRGAPAEITLDKLVSLSTLPQPGVRYFSGVATYTKTFDLPADALAPERRCVLELGCVRDIASVRVNGQSAGVVWTAPFEVDVTALLRAGQNTVEIAVADRWVNRLIGDETLPPDAKYSTDGSKFTLNRLAEFPPWWNDAKAIQARQRVAFATWKHFDADSPLVESGLIGPVRLVFERSVPLAGGRP